MDPITGIIIEKGAEAATEEAKGLIRKFLGPAADEAGLYLADTVRHFRLRNQIRLFKTAEKILAKEGINPKAVSFKALYSLLEPAILESDDRMADRWASLLASAADPNSGDEQPSFPELLKQLNPSQASLLDLFYSSVLVIDPNISRWRSRGISSEKIRSHLGMAEDSFLVSVDNLVRLRLLQFPTAALTDRENDASHEMSSHLLLSPTFLGKVFFRACSRGTSPISQVPRLDWVEDARHNEQDPRWG